MFDMLFTLTILGLVFLAGSGIGAIIYITFIQE